MEPDKKELYNIEILGDQIDEEVNTIDELVEKIKNYSSKDKEYVKEYNKKYYAKNKEKHLKNIKHMTEKVVCEICDREISRGKLSVHNKTKIHQKNLNKI